MSYNSPFTDMFKNAFDFNQLFSTQRRNIEAISAANQAFVEGAQAVSRVQAEAVRSSVESVLKASKDIMTAGTPEGNLAKQADLARDFFESTLANLREITETVTKSGFEAFEVLNRRAAESIEEISKASHSPAKKKSS